MVGIGIDSVDVERFRLILERRPSLAERLFTAAERAYAEAQADPAPSLAVRFAAKEATMKAMGVGLGAFEFHDVEVVRAETGAPSLHLSAAAADISRSLGVTSWRVSLTHTCSTATAMVIAE